MSYEFIMREYDVSLCIYFYQFYHIMSHQIALYLTARSRNALQPGCCRRVTSEVFAKPGHDVAANSWCCDLQRAYMYMYIYIWCVYISSIHISHQSSSLHIIHLFSNCFRSISECLSQLKML